MPAMMETPPRTWVVNPDEHHSLELGGGLRGATNRLSCIHWQCFTIDGLDAADHLALFAVRRTQQYFPMR